jgi:hypothetical protein
MKLYEGFFKDNMYHDGGRLFQCDHYIAGTWKEGILNGKAIVFPDNGMKYFGNFINGIKNGQG